MHLHTLRIRREQRSISSVTLHLHTLADCTLTPTQIQPHLLLRLIVNVDFSPSPAVTHTEGPSAREGKLSLP